jgi:hypothetical protein
MAVAPLSHSARDYVRAFDLTCIALWRDGRLGVSRNPTGAEEAWWCPAMADGTVVVVENISPADYEVCVRPADAADECLWIYRSSLTLTH